MTVSTNNLSAADGADAGTLAPDRAIVYAPERLRAEFEALLTDLNERAQTESVRDVLGNDLLRALRQDDNKLRTRLAGDFKLVVLGDFKRGKSSLINALLETPVATTNVTPETVSINEIGYGGEMRAEVCLQDGGRVALQPHELAADYLQPLLARLPQPVSHLEIQAPISWLRGVQIVDTPGLGDIFKRFDQQVHDYLHHADAVLFLVSALSPLSESEETFLRLSLQPQEFPKLTFVVNLLDFARTDEEADRVLAHISSQINQMFPNAPVFGVSALDELCRIQGAPRPNPARAPALEMAFQQLRDHLQQAVLLDRDLIQLDRASDHLRRVLDGFENSVSLLKNALQRNQVGLVEAISELEDKNSALSRRIAQHKTRMRNEIVALGEQADGWMSAFMDRFYAEAVGGIPTFPYADVQRHFHFFVTDVLRDAMSRCLSAHQSAIIESANTAKKAIIGDVQVASYAGVEATDVALATAGGPAWSQMDTIGFALSQFLPVSDLLKFGAKLIMNRSENAKQLTHYQQRVEAGLPELRQGVSQEIKTAYSRIAHNLEQQIDIAYQQDREDALAAMRRAQDIHAQGEQKVAVAQNAFTAIDTVLSDARHSLESFEGKLWPNDTTDEADEVTPTRAAGSNGSAEQTTPAAPAQAATGAASPV